MKYILWCYFSEGHPLHDKKILIIDVSEETIILTLNLKFTKLSETEVKSKYEVINPPIFS